MISIVVPVYNVEKYLNQCVESIVNQSYSDLEIILVDDGSKDDSGRLCDLWAKRDTRVRVIHKENGGLSSARNAGIEVAIGQFIGFVDSDDYIEKDMYEVLLNMLEKYNADLACAGRYTHINGSVIKQEYITNCPIKMTSEEAIEEVLLNKKIDVAAWDKLYKIELFKTIRYPVGRINEDAAVIFQLLHMANRIVHCGKPLYHYIYHSESISKIEYTHKRYDVYINCSEFSHFIEKYHKSKSELCKGYCAQCAVGVLESIYNTPNAMITFRQDYNDFRKLLKEGISSLMKQQRIPLKRRLWAFMIYCKLNSLIKLIRKVTSIWKK